MRVGDMISIRLGYEFVVDISLGNHYIFILEGIPMTISKFEKHKGGLRGTFLQL
jgi:hypothetical protein